MAIIIDLLPSLTILYKYTTNVNQIRSSRFLDDESRLVKDRTAEKEEAAKAEDLNKTRPIEKSKNLELVERGIETLEQNIILGVSKQ